MSERKIICLTGIIFLCFCNCIQARAEDFWKDHDGEKIAEMPYIKSKGGMGAQMQFITDTSFFDQWRKTDEELNGLLPHMAVVNEVTRNTPLYPVVLFSLSDTLVAKPCDITYHVIVNKPDGSVYADIPDLKGCPGPKLPPQVLVLTPDRVGIRIEDKDPLGKYNVKVTIRDNNSGTEIELINNFVAK